MQRLEVSGAVRPVYGSLGIERLKHGSKNHISELRKVQKQRVRKTAKRTKCIPYHTTSS